MKILWLCNIILPAVSNELNLKASNKEGWLSGICDAVSKEKSFKLAICFPVPKKFAGHKWVINEIAYYGFYEDTKHPEKYDHKIENQLMHIVEDFEPDLVHVFGTEYPHTLAMCRCIEDKPRIKSLIGFQGILDIYKNHYFDGLPESVIETVTFRDFLKNDSLKKQQRKYELRAVNEVEAVRLAKHVTGRTPFDKGFSERVNPDAEYHFLNETLRKDFYEGEWKADKCEKHSIFLSQGNYPIKGLHVMLEALNLLKCSYPDIKVYVAGDNVTKKETFKDRLKLSAYGKYILKLLKDYDVSDKVIFLGSIDALKIKKQLLKSNIFVCPSTIENSPNSLGEAMILGVPSITSNVGGISGIFERDVDGLMFDSCEAGELAKCIDDLFKDVSLQIKFSSAASLHAKKTHNAGNNYRRLVEIYEKICK